MNLEQLSSALCSGNVQLRLDQIVVSTGVEKFRGSGILEIRDDEMQVRVVLGKRSKLPLWQKSVWSQEDFWKLTGRIEHSLTFSATNVIPVREIRNGESTESVLRFTSFTLIQKRSSLARYRRLFDHVAAKYKNEPDPPSASKTKGRGKKISVARFEATILGCKPIAHNLATNTVIRNKFLGKTTSWVSDTFVEKTSTYEVALIEKDDRNLEIHYRSMGRYKSTSAKIDRHRFQAVLEAVAFTHGFNPWPFRLRQWRNGLEVESRFGVPRTPPTINHAPFDEALSAYGHTPPISLIARFFEKRSELVTYVSDFLFIFRQAGEKGVHLPVTTLAFCSLFEGLVNRLFSELKLEESLRRIANDDAEFVAARKRLFDELKEKASKGDIASKRLAGLVGHAEPFRVKDKFFAVCESLGLDQNAMSRHYDAWYNERNPLMHGRWRAHSDQDFERQSLIAGAINILLLKLMGYSGRVVASRFAMNHSDVYRTI